MINYRIFLSFWYTSHPYVIEQKRNALRLCIYPQGSKQLFWLCATILFLGVTIFNMVMLREYIINNLTWDYTYKGIAINIIVLIANIFITIFLFSNYWWRRYGIETFLIEETKLVYSQSCKGWKTTIKHYNFEKLEINYLSENNIDVYNEDETLATESELENVIGSYPIRFNINDGLQIIDSERKITIEAIRLVKKILTH